MPAILESCIAHVMDKGHDKSSAFAICRASMGLMTDGSEDMNAPADMSPEEMMRRADKAMALDQPVVVKEIVVAHAGKNFKNGDQAFDLTRADLARMVANFTDNPRQVPVLFAGDHAIGPARADRPADGWVDGLRLSGNDLMARVRLYGLAADMVQRDRFRGISIGARDGKDLKGNPIGWYLDHLLITNAPFFSDLDIAAVRSRAGDGAVIYLSARMEAAMAEPNKDKDLSLAEIEAKHAADIKTKDDEIVGLKAQVMNLTEQIETLQKQIETVGTDPEKDDLKLRMATLERINQSNEIRQLVASGLKRGVLKAAWVQGYEGNGKGHEGTLSWFKASRFDGDLKLLKYQVEKAEPFIRLDQSYRSGLPPAGTEEKLTEEDRTFVRSLGIDPDLFPTLMKARDLGDFKELTKKGN